MWPWLVAGSLGSVMTAGAVVLRHRRRRDRIYAELARQREAIVAQHPLCVTAAADREALACEFARTSMIRIPGFLSPDSLADLRAEAVANLPRAERSFIPGHKKGGTLSYEAVSRFAPRCLAAYHSPILRDWVSTIIGAPVVPTRDQDQSSLSVLCYNEPGDHINWHFDHNFYRGRHFTVLLSLANEGAQSGLSSSRLQRKTRSGEVVELDTSPGTLVVFEGARVLHRATPTAPGDLRLMLSMTYCTDPHIHWTRELLRRMKDTAYYGVRALWD